MNAEVLPMKPREAMPVDMPLVAIEAEQALLGALLVNNHVLPAVSSIISAEHFAEDLHRHIFAIASEMIAAGQAATPATLKPFLGQWDEPLAEGSVTLGAYVARLCAEAITIAGAPGYARTIRDLAHRRRLVETGEQLAKASRAAIITEDPATLASAAITDLQEVAGAGRGIDTRLDAGVSAALVIERAKRIVAGEEHDSAISTGLPGLDRDTAGGFHPGDLWIVGGRPGLGKSILATGFATKIATRGTGVLLFSLELNERQVLARILADLAYSSNHRIVYRDIVSANLSDTDLWHLEDAQKRLNKMPLVIDVASRLTVPQIVAKVRAEKTRMAKHGTELRVIFIDYLKMVASSDRYRGQRVLEVGEISGALKQLAKDEEVCVVLLSQLNRASVGRESKDKRPDLLALRDSGDLEADADVVAFIHREAYYIAQSPEYRSGIDAEAQNLFIEKQFGGEIILAKSRLGPAGIVPIWCDVGCSTFAAQARGQ